MLDCLILGDSIAVGTQQVMPRCELVAHVGYNSWQWNQVYGERAYSAKTAIISLGTNDHQYVKTERELETLRTKLDAQRVFWVLPSGNSPKSGVSLEHIQGIVRAVANRHGDTVLTVSRLQADKIHPSDAGYRQIADKVSQHAGSASVKAP